MRSWSVVLFVLVSGAGFAVATNALASKTETGASHTLIYAGTHADGSVRFVYSDIETLHRHRGGVTATNVDTVSSVRITDGCHPRGTLEKQSVVIKHRHFQFPDRTFSVVGRTAGSPYEPKRITLAIRDSRPYCDTGGLRVTARPVKPGD